MENMEAQPSLKSSGSHAKSFERGPPLKDGASDAKLIGDCSDGAAADSARYEIDVLKNTLAAYQDCVREQAHVQQLRLECAIARQTAECNQRDLQNLRVFVRQAQQGPVCCGSRRVAVASVLPRKPKTSKPAASKHEAASTAGAAHKSVKSVKTKTVRRKTVKK